MHCIGDLIHILPLVLIAALYLFTAIPARFRDAAVAVVALFGVIFGSLFHQSHGLMIFDSCYLYAIALGFSSFKLLRSAFLQLKSER